MKKMGKKMLAFSLAALMCLQFAGCSKKNDESDRKSTAEVSQSSEKETKPETENTKETEEKVEWDGKTTLIWYVMGAKPEDYDLVMEKVNEITKEKIGAALEMNFISAGDFSQKISLMMSSNEKFDLAFTCSWANPYYDGARKGGFLDISDYLEERPALKEALPEYLWEAATVDGGIYAVPNYQATATTKAVYLRKDLVDKYQFDTSQVKKLTDLEPYFDIILEKESGVYPYQPGNESLFLEDPYQFEEVSVDGLGYDTKTGKVVYLNATEEYKAAYLKAREWYKKGYIRKDIETGATGQDFKNGLYAATTTTGYRPGELETSEKNMGYELIAIPLDENYHMQKSKVLASMTAVSATSENPDKAMDLLELVNTDSELINLLTFGIEGVHYEKISDNKIRKIDSGYCSNSAWMYGNIFNSYLQEGESDTLYQDIKNANETAVADKYLGFLADTNEYTTILSNISSFAGQYYFTMGSKDIDNLYDEYMQKLKAAGYEKLVEGIQKQIDEYDKNQ